MRSKLPKKYYNVRDEIIEELVRMHYIEKDESGYHAAMTEDFVLVSKRMIVDVIRRISGVKAYDFSTLMLNDLAKEYRLSFNDNMFGRHWEAVYTRRDLLEEKLGVNFTDMPRNKYRRLSAVFQKIRRKYDPRYTFNFFADFLVRQNIFKREELKVEPMIYRLCDKKNRDKPLL